MNHLLSIFSVWNTKVILVKFSHLIRIILSFFAMWHLTKTVIFNWTYYFNKMNTFINSNGLFLSINQIIEENDWICHPFYHYLYLFVKVSLLTLHWMNSIILKSFTQFIFDQLIYISDLNDFLEREINLNSLGVVYLELFIDVHTLYTALILF